MPAQLLTLDFDSKKAVSSRSEIIAGSAGVRCLFAGVSSKRPDLVTRQIFEDIQKRIDDSSALSHLGVRTQNYLRKNPVTSAGADMWEAEVRFYLSGDEAYSYPFLILRADHKRGQDAPFDVQTEFTLLNGFGRSACRTALRGKNYDVEIAPYISQRLHAVLELKSIPDSRQAYEAWTPD